MRLKIQHRLTEDSDFYSVLLLTILLVTGSRPLYSEVFDLLTENVIPFLHTDYISLSSHLIQHCIDAAVVTVSLNNPQIIQETRIALTFFMFLMSCSGRSAWMTGGELG